MFFFRPIYVIIYYIYICTFGGTMKRCIIALILCIIGAAAFGQSADVSLFRTEYFNNDSTFEDRLKVLEAVRDTRMTGIGEFYHDALKFLILRSADISTRAEQEAAEQSAIILCQGLGAEKYVPAAADLWKTAEVFDVARALARTQIYFEGLAMQEALTALGQVEGKTFVPQVVLRLNNFNTQTFTDVETRRRVQRAVYGCISALENFHDISGFRPVFFVAQGSYDPPVRERATNTLPNIVDDPGEVIAAIIRDPSNNPRIKLVAWKEMLKTRAPGSSKASVAAVALATGWNYTTQDVNFQTNLREMRKEAIESIRQFGVADDSVYTNLERSYANNFANAAPDYDEIRLTLNALSAVKSNEAVALLEKFLSDLYDRRKSGPWSRKERQCLEWVVFSIGATKTENTSVKFLLDTMSRDNKFTGAERNWITAARKNLG
jgi:hypothetical protein